MPWLPVAYPPFSNHSPQIKEPSLCRLRLHKEESGIVFTLLRSGHTSPHQRNGNVPHRIPPVNAPATPLPARPPVCSSPQFLNAPLTSSAEERASVLRPLRYHRTLAVHISKIQTRSPTKNKKGHKGSPRSVPCKGPPALRVRTAKISTAGEDESLPHLPKKGAVVFFRAQP